MVPDSSKASSPTGAKKILSRCGISEQRSMSLGRGVDHRNISARLTH